MYASVVGVGLVGGFFAPKQGPEEPRPSPPAEVGTAGALSALSVATPVSADKDGAESPELHALRVDERLMFGEPPPAVAPFAPPFVAGCPENAPYCDEAGAARWMSGLRMPDLPVHADPAIGRLVQYYTEDAGGRKTFRSWLKRSGRYRGVIEASLRDQMIPRDLMALVCNESGFSPTAVSSAGAVGLWQMMPETARAYGLTVEDDFDERRGTEKVSGAAARLLSDLYEKFGTWELALAAYNLGYKGMLDRVRDTGSNDYWTLRKLKGGLPAETAAYVPRVVALAIVMNNLEHFSLSDEHLDPPNETGDLSVPSGTSAALVARAAGTSIERFRELNPELLADTIPSRGHDFVVHVPSTGLARARLMLPRLLDRRDRDGLESEVSRSFDWGKDEVPVRAEVRRRDVDSERSDGEEARPGVVLYRVGDRDSLEEIARSFGTSVDEIAEANYLDPGAKLQRGMLLSIRAREDVLGRIMRRRAAARLKAPDPTVEHDPPSAKTPNPQDAHSPRPPTSAETAQNVKPRS
jgi:membrane-bound lytic murein transglycosylase D